MSSNPTPINKALTFRPAPLPVEEPTEKLDETKTPVLPFVAARPTDPADTVTAWQRNQLLLLAPEKAAPFSISDARILQPTKEPIEQLREILLARDFLIVVKEKWNDEQKLGLLKALMAAKSDRCDDPSNPDPQLIIGSVFDNYINQNVPDPAVYPTGPSIVRSERENGATPYKIKLEGTVIEQLKQILQPKELMAIAKWPEKHKTRLLDALREAQPYWNAGQSEDQSFGHILSVFYNFSYTSGPIPPEKTPLSFDRQKPASADPAVPA